MTHNNKQNQDKFTQKSKLGIREFNALNEKTYARESKGLSIRVRNVASFIGKISQEDQDAMMLAFQNDDVNAVDKIKARVQFESGCIHYPDLTFPKGSTVKKLKVIAYSAQTNDEQLLHYLLGKTN